MDESFSAAGFLVQTPCGPRKSGIQDSVEMPAPVSATTRRARLNSATASTYSSLAGIENLHGYSRGRRVERDLENQAPPDPPGNGRHERPDPHHPAVLRVQRGVAARDALRLALDRTRGARNP